VILVHGVNDLGEAFAAQEEGLCAGLNERLGRTRWDLKPGAYRFPVPGGAQVEPHPDMVFYRRDGGQAYSPVIPFYWGYRAEEKAWNHRRKKWEAGISLRNGEFLDRYGNRVDKDHAKGGGPFANATSTLPDMYGPGFTRWGKGAFSSPTHPFHDCPPRTYMVLAAKRLAALIALIRDHQPGAAINLVGHSQGCMVSLLATALLADEGQPPPDTLILNHPPYGLESTVLGSVDHGVMDRSSQQADQARVETLVRVVNHVWAKAAREPAFQRDLLLKAHGGGIGHTWGTKQNPFTLAQEPFPERDNRGKVYLYFCPEDRTVSLVSVKGIGWQGVPSALPVQVNGERTTLSVLDRLGPGFRQRVFTFRQRPGAVAVGLPPHPFVLFQGKDPSMGLGRANPPKGVTRDITGEALHPPIFPTFTWGEVRRGQLGMTPVDAAIAVAETGGKAGGVTETIPDPRPGRSSQALPAAGARHPRAASSSPPHPGEIRRLLNQKVEERVRGEHPQAKPEELEQLIQQKSIPAIQNVREAGGGRILLQRTETPDEARARWQQQSEGNSYHSAIVACPHHSRYVTTYDLSIGAAFSKDVEEFCNYLCLLADWRTLPKSLKEEDLWENEKKKEVFEDTFKYYDGDVSVLEGINEVDIPKMLGSLTRKQERDMKDAQYSRKALERAERNPKSIFYK
jgi:hypothetical protein